MLWRYFVFSTYRVHFEINEFPSCESDYNLALIHGAFGDCSLSRCPPFVHTFVGADVTNSVRVDLYVDMNWLIISWKSTKWFKIGNPTHIAHKLPEPKHPRQEPNNWVSVLCPRIQNLWLLQPSHQYLVPGLHWRTTLWYTRHIPLKPKQKLHFQH